MSRVSNAFVVVVLALGALGFVVAAAPAAEAAAESGPYVITAAPYGTSDYVAVRYHKKTGESWVMQRNAWKKVKENAEVPAGNYTVVFASSAQPEQKSWFGFRVDSNSGKSWRLADQVWHAIENVEE